MQKERFCRVEISFRKFHTPPYQRRFCSAPSLINGVTHPNISPPEQKALCLKNENEAKSRCQTGHKKSASEFI